jgi:hypothetical protein
MTRWLKLAAGLLVGVIACGGVCLAHAVEAGRTFFVSATSGNDRHDGRSPQSPWRILDRVNTADLKAGDRVLFRRGETWRGTLVPRSGRQGAPITYGAYGEGDKPLLLGSVSRNDSRDWHPEGDNIWATAKPTFADLTSAELSRDVGNIVFDHGKAVGVKKWRSEDLRRQGDYRYCGDTWQVKLYSKQNPAELYRNVELALCRHIIDQGNKSHVVYENLSLRYGAAHGIGGGNTHHIVVRGCDLGWIGGGHQFTTPAGTPVRFGNGIEFWAGAHDNLVEACRIWEVYDAALTNQGSADNSQINITYRDNVIWNCEYSFEYWNRGPESTTRNIRFEHNTCVNAGHGWGHTQRPDPNGRHVMFYSNSARTTEFYVCKNIFCGATESCLRMDNEWTAGLVMDRNCWFQPGPVLMRFLNTQFAPTQLADFQRRTHIDSRSIVAEPKFVNAGHLDFRLADDSPARSLPGDGTSVGARQRLAK